MNVEFIDTNLLVYAYNGDAGSKGVTAAELVKRLWRERSGRLSTQVLHEFFHTMTRKYRLPVVDARAIVGELAEWDPVVITTPMTLDAIDLSARWQTSFWDGLILAAARSAGATLLWTEDLAHGQRYGAVEVRSPFR